MYLIQRAIEGTNFLSTSVKPYSQVPVIALTSSQTSDRINRAYELGVNSCVMKSESGGLQSEVARGIGSYAKCLKSYQ